jgi:hypothetical protein
LLLAITKRNKTENHFSLQSLPAFTYQFVHKAQNRNVLLIAGKTCNKLPTFGQKKDAMLLPAYGRKKCLQYCRPTAVYIVCNFSARLPGKAAGKGCQTRLPDKAARQGCQTRLPDKAARQGCQTRLLDKAAGQGCRTRLPKKAAGQVCRTRLHAMVQYDESMSKMKFFD